MCFLWPEGIKISEVYRRVVAQYNEHCMTQKSVYKWEDRFQYGKATLDDE
jgi:hypothetical protein